jgi:SGNH domain (fused to AT3 domains)
LFGDTRTGRPIVALIGDSYAQHLFDGINSAAKTAGWSLLVLTRTSCPPVMADTISDQTGIVDVGCRNWLDQVLQRLERDRPDLILISSWEGAARRMADPATQRRFARSASTEAWQLGFYKLLDRLKQNDIKTVVVPSTPRGRFSELETCFTRSPSHQCAEPKPSAMSYSQLAQDVARSRAVRALDLNDYFCNAHVCHSVRDGEIVYRDRSHHLTASFSLKLAPAYLSLLRATSLAR